MIDSHRPTLEDLLFHAQRELQEIRTGSERELQTLASRFEELAQRTTAILDCAGRIVACAAEGQLVSHLASVRSLGPSAQALIAARLTAAAQLGAALGAEGNCLMRLSRFSRSQSAIVRETEMLRILTRIEVARLGADGQGFQYLADELDDFSRVLQGSVGELTRHTSERRAAIEAAQHSLLAGLPRIREEFAAVEQALRQAVVLVEGSMLRLSEVPGQYQACVQEVAGLIAGVVAAVQTQDITHQQLEHVREALQRLAEIAQPAAQAEPSGVPILRAGLQVQAFQLKSARRTVAGWIARIHSCLGAIMRISCGDLAEIGSSVLTHERELSAHLARIEQLDRHCQAGQAEVQESMGGIRSLMLLVREHLEKSKAVRDRLQLLMFNSIVEAGRLGSHADGIREISMSIKRLSTRWDEITHESEQTVEDMLAQVEQSENAFQAFTAGGDRGMGEADVESALEGLRAAAAYAENEGREIHAQVQLLQTAVAEIGASAGSLETCFRSLDSALEGVEAAERQLRPASGEESAPDFAELEHLFSQSYTTETEREVLRSALTGAALPEVQQTCCGNDVELF